MPNISEIAKKLSERITIAETRKCLRTAEESRRFLYAIEHILTDIWKANYVNPGATLPNYTTSHTAYPKKSTFSLTKS